MLCEPNKAGDCLTHIFLIPENKTIFENNNMTVRYPSYTLKEFYNRPLFNLHFSIQAR